MKSTSPPVASFHKKQENNQKVHKTGKYITPECWWTPKCWSIPREKLIFLYFEWKSHILTFFKCCHRFGCIFYLIRVNFQLLWDKIKINNISPGSQPEFRCQPAFRSGIWTLVDLFVVSCVFTFFLHFGRKRFWKWWKVDFHQRMACKAPVCWLKLITYIVVVLILFVYCTCLSCYFKLQKKFGTTR